MVIRENSRIEKDISVNHLTTPGEIREFLLAEWAKEEPMQKYRYFVDTFDDGKRGYLERPGRLNKGCDFVIFIEELFLHKNGNDKPPSHKDLFSDLQSKKTRLTSACWQHLIASINAVHKIRPYDIPAAYIDEINALPGMTVQQICFLCNWFFIEQDLTYWSGKGRSMLFDAINSFA